MSSHRRRRIKIVHVVGARPNFMKVAPIMKEMDKRPRRFEQVLVHTGQHYDKNMSRYFFEELHLPRPDVYLGVGSGSHSEQTARVMVGFEKVLKELGPDYVLVVGDVNSTLACSVVASKLWIPVIHVEAGLRSFDRTMPEEINRIVTDRLSDVLFTTCEDANRNLKKEGAPKGKIHFVGNVMIDTLIRYRAESRKSSILSDLGLTKRRYAVITMHRPSNVDHKYTLRRLFEAFHEIGGHLPVVFPAHPRTVKQMKKFGIKHDKKKVRLLEPLGYLDFLRLYMDSMFVITDSGGIQEETTYLGIPCLTIRENTERPVTIKKGTNILVGTDKDKIIRESLKILRGKGKKGAIPPLWDGKAARRIVDVLKTR